MVILYYLTAILLSYQLNFVEPFRNNWGEFKEDYSIRDLEYLQHLRFSNQLAFSLLNDSIRAAEVRIHSCNHIATFYLSTFSISTLLLRLDCLVLTNALVFRNKIRFGLRF